MSRRPVQDVEGPKRPIPRASRSGGWVISRRLEPLLVALKSPLAQIPEVVFAYLFGSALKGLAFHDLDIAVYLSPCPPHAYERFKLAMRIGQWLERALQPRYEVDVKILNEAPVPFQYEVISTGSCLVEQNHYLRICYEAQVLSAYVDYRPAWERLVGRHLGRSQRMEQPPEIVQHLEEMAEALADWERYQNQITLEQIRINRDTRYMVLHAMLVTIQAAIDIALFLIAQRGLRTPNTYREAFDILVEASLLPTELGDELSTLAGFRNGLVHIYWRLDLQRAYEVLQEGMAPLRQFYRIAHRLLFPD